MKDAISLLKKDHVNVKQLFRKFEKAEGAEEVGVRAELFRQIHEELAVHTQVEEEIVYPALEDIGTQESAEYHEEAHEEHDEVKHLLEEMTHLEPSTEQFVLDMGKIIQGVEHHIREEEEGIFPLMKKYIPKARLLQMGELIEERKAALA